MKIANILKTIALISIQHKSFAGTPTQNTTITDITTERGHKIIRGSLSKETVFIPNSKPKYLDFTDESYKQLIEKRRQNPNQKLFLTFETVS